MFERPKAGEQTILVQVAIKQKQPATTDGEPTGSVSTNTSAAIDRAELDFAEFQQLAMSAGAKICGDLRGGPRHIDPKYFLGKGKVEELQQLVQHTGAELVIFNHALSPAQERNLEKELSCRVLDRNGLILDIFAARAQTYEGKLQVELAQLEHLSSRLVRGWTHLERQKGGIGLRGPGETQLEVDRRLVDKRISLIKSRLDKVKVQRALSRRARDKQQAPVIALVGYTNAGKSTLFNALTTAAVYAADQLFATLDPCLRQINLAQYGRVILVDTVGFIRDLPHQLISAFLATLEETRQADLLLHVVDVADPDHQDQIVQVNRVLTTIDAQQVPAILVYNKIDLLADQQPRIDYDENHAAKRVWLSAMKTLGLDLLREAMATRLGGEFIIKTIQLSVTQSQQRAAFYALGAVLAEEVDEAGTMTLTLKLPAQIFRQFSDEKMS